MVQIVRPQPRMMEVYMSDAGDQQMRLQLRALDESLAESSRLHKLTELAAIEPGMLYLVATAAHHEQLAYSVRAWSEAAAGTHSLHLLLVWSMHFSNGPSEAVKMLSRASAPCSSLAGSNVFSSIAGICAQFAAGTARLLQPQFPHL